jgi:hypothetical protein
MTCHQRCSPRENLCIRQLSRKVVLMLSRKKWVPLLLLLSAFLLLTCRPFKKLSVIFALSLPSLLQRTLVLDEQIALVVDYC